MATMTAPIREFTRPAAIASPLQRLKRTIRTYVVVETLVWCLLWMCAWCWFTFLLDWGLFKVLGLDYVRDGSTGVQVTLRIIFLALLFGGMGAIVMFKGVLRLLASFREPALALVLERRFPGILGDRLVTAVELGDPDMAKHYGYSWEMVEETTQGAAARVGEVNLGKVFNWSRLVLRGLLALVLVGSVVTFGVLATDTAAIWLERDLFTMHTLWPQNTMIDLPDFRTVDNKAVAYGSDFRVRMNGWKWVVSTRQTPTGWRPLVWGDLFPNEPGITPTDEKQPWELANIDFPVATVHALPAGWRQLPLDLVEMRLHGDANSAESQAHLAELGAGILKHAAMQITTARAANQSQLNEAMLALLPEAWRTITLDELTDVLAATQRLTPAEVKRLQAALAGRHILPADAVQSLNAALSPITPFILATPALQPIAAQSKTQAFGLSDADRAILPAAWRTLSTKELDARLQEFVTKLSVERLGEPLRQTLRGLFDELERRAAQSHVAARVRFRQLDVPKQLTLEFEQVLTDDERARVKPKLGRPTVNRISRSNDYIYDFKKIERATRFRVMAGDSSTGWLRIDVKPIPTLRKLSRMQDELGYYFNSNERFKSGPITISLEGEESRFDVTAGTRLELHGESYKPLKWIRLAQPGQGAESSPVSKLAGQAVAQAAPVGGSVLSSLASVPLAGQKQTPLVENLEHEEGSDTFRMKLRELGADSLSLKLEFEDTDGITGNRKLIIAVMPDKEPEFRKAQFEIVRREMITTQAIIPFSGHVHDDHGLLSLQYEATLEQMDRTPIRKHIFSFRRFMPLVMSDPNRLDLRFERPDQVLFSRLVAGPRWEHAFAQTSLARFPLTGFIGLHQPPSLEIPKDYVFDYAPRAGDEHPYGAFDEGLDTSLIQTQAEAMTGADGKPLAKLAPPYRLSIRMLARDNRARSDGPNRTIAANQTAASPETFEFVVVAEEDLLIELGKKEEELRDRCEQIINAIKSGRTILKRIRDDFENLKDDADFRRAANDSRDVLKIVRDSHAATDVEVVREFRQVYKELLLNRCRQDVLDRINDKICEPLEFTIRAGNHFDKAENAVDAQARRIELEKSKSPRQVMENSVEVADQLISRLEDILNEMKKLIEFNQALQVLRDLIRAEEDILKILQKKEKDKKAEELRDK